MAQSSKNEIVTVSLCLRRAKQLAEGSFAELKKDGHPGVAFPRILPSHRSKKRR
jgi:hypothetical protein